jgi:hypothetical protein
MNTQKRLAFHWRSLKNYRKSLRMIKTLKQATMKYNYNLEEEAKLLLERVWRDLIIKSNMGYSDQN